MKSFNAICRMTQAELKAYMKEYLASKAYDVIDEDGFLYAKGDKPVLLLAHLDTVHPTRCVEIHEKDGKISSPQGIGGDDRCGIFIIMNLVKELHCSVLLCEDEEKGGKGARKFVEAKKKVTNENGKTKEIKYVDDLGVNYMIEFDRKGGNDAVFYQCDNKKFTEFVTKTTGYKEAFGSFSDISVVAPAAKIAAVNLSSGYYNPHTLNEYVLYNEMMYTMDMAGALILSETEKFEYVKKAWTPTVTTVKPKSKTKASRTYSQTSLFDIDLEICLEVVYVDLNLKECSDEFYGNTKAEAWANFFLTHTDVCYDMIVDYSFD